MLASSTTMEMDEIEEPVSDRVSNVASRTSKHHERRNHDGSSEDNNGYYMTTISSPPAEQVKNLPPYSLSDIDEDLITDTVGAIAIDMFGNIAAGSSSGGIGMKHRGRVGPAALVGIGTAVIPADFEDSDNVTVAAVTSGTGEHMATTMASQKCAERLYFCTKRGRGGTNVEATEEEAMESFVVNDFMNHPGVKSSHSAGAIGIMAVKKTPYGYFLHFAHNTDSFALASMHSGEKEPKCVMSRLGDHGTVVQGGRKIRVE
jgi:taspase (threonine aspartase 1)